MGFVNAAFCLARFPLLAPPRHPHAQAAQTVVIPAPVPRPANAVVAPPVAPVAVAPYGAVSDCTSAGALAQNFVVTTNSSDAVSVGDFVALVFDFDLGTVVRTAVMLCSHWGQRRPMGRGLPALALDAPPAPHTPRAQVNDGSQYYNCTVNGFLPYNTVDDLCTSQANSPDPCPLGVGHHTVRRDWGRAGGGRGAGCRRSAT